MNEKKGNGRNLGFLFSYFCSGRDGDIGRANFEKNGGYLRLPSREGVLAFFHLIANVEAPRNC